MTYCQARDTVIIPVTRLTPQPRRGLAHADLHDAVEADRQVGAPAGAAGPGQAQVGDGELAALAVVAFGVFYILL